MLKLLVAFDGSDNALRAVRYAIDLVKENPPVSLHLVHAHDEPIVYGEIAVYITPEKMAELQREESELVLAAAEKVLRDAGVPFTSEILIGSIPLRISQRADELGCDGIVMGSVGRTAIGSLLMGSVASKVAHHSNVPVTLVK